MAVSRVTTWSPGNTLTADALNGEFDNLITGVNSALSPTATDSTTARTTDARFGDYANVKDFGAVGDDSTDCTTAFNLAILTGKRVYVPKGTYRCTALDAATGSLYIQGDGRASKIVFNTTGHGLTISGMSAAQNKTCTIKDLAFGNVTNTPTSIIRNAGALNFLVDRCFFSDLSATYCIDNVLGYGGQIRNCVFSDVTGGAIILRDDGAVLEYSYVFGIEGCDITRPSGIGIACERSQLLRITKTVIEGCGGTGLAIGTAGITVSDVSLDTCYFEGNTGTDVDLMASGGSYWTRGTFTNCFFNQSSTVALGDKSKAIFIGMQGSGGSHLTVSGSDNAEAWFVGCEMGNVDQSGTFAWFVEGIWTVSTANLPAANSALNGKVMIEETGANSCNLVAYKGGERFKVAMTES
jgi:hypothetical protein